MPPLGMAGATWFLRDDIQIFFGLWVETEVAGLLKQFTHTD